MTHLLSIKKVASFRDVRAEEVSSLMKTVSSQAAVGGVINMSDALNSFSNNVICKAVSGKLEGRSEMFQKLIEENSALAGSFHVGDYLPWLAWLDMFLGLNVRAKRNAKRWSAILDEVLEDHDSSSKGVGREGHDFSDVLLSLQKDSTMGFEFTKEHIKSLLMDMFAAGTDTTYILLEWAMSELVRNPKVMKKLQEELRKLPNRGSNAMIREEDLKELQYLKAVLKETLRLHPPVPLLIPRESIEDCQIQGYMIPKKTRVIINAWAIGRDPHSWEAADEFQPERFMEGGGSLVEFKGNDFRFIPFGAGRRICPGMTFSMSTAELALVNLVSNFDWELTDGRGGDELDMAESPGLTMRKKQELHLVAKPCLR